MNGLENNLGRCEVTGKRLLSTVGFSVETTCTLQVKEASHLHQFKLMREILLFPLSSWHSVSIRYLHAAASLQTVDGL